MKRINNYYTVGVEYITYYSFRNTDANRICKLPPL